MKHDGVVQTFLILLKRNGGNLMNSLEIARKLEGITKNVHLCKVLTIFKVVK